MRPGLLVAYRRLLDSHPGDVGVVASAEIVYEAGENDWSGEFREIGRTPFWDGMTEVS